MSKKKQDDISVEWLYSKGYTISAAARRICRTPNHVSLVLRGKRESLAVSAALRALPARPLMVLREKLQPTH